MTPDQYCQEKTANSGSSFYYSFLFLPEQQRRAITALYAFCREVDDVVDECSEPSVAKVKLHWWYESMQATYKGNPQHLVQRALVEHIQRLDLPLELFLEIIRGMEMDLVQNRYQSFDELRLYCYRAAGAVGLLAAKIFGYTDKEVEDYAENLGLAFQLTNIIRDVKEDARRGRIYIPLDELKHYGVLEKDILDFTHSDNMNKLLQAQVQRAQDFYDTAFSHLPDADRYAQRCGIIMSALYRKILFKIEKDVSTVLDQRTSITPFLKLWIAWRTARHEKVRHKNFLQMCNA